MKLCYIGNAASHYRKKIFSMMDEAFNCDWVFGIPVNDIKQMDTTSLKGHVERVKIKDFFSGKAYWLSGVIKYAFKNYTHYLIIGDERCLSLWILIFLLKFMPGKKVYYWTHGAYGKEGLIKRLVERLFNSMADGEFIYNNYSRNILIQRGQRPEKLFTIYNSLDYDNQLKLRNSGLSSKIYQQHFKNNYPVLLFIGRLTKVKKLDQLVDAVSLLKKQGTYYNLVIVGDGKETDYLKHCVNINKLGAQTWFYGACYDEKMNAVLIYNADLCVAPGNVGLTAMHAMVFGTPVISHNNFPWQMPEFEAIKSGVTGDFFDMDNVKSLASKINQWFNDKRNREEIRKACYNEIDTKWTPHNQMKVLRKVFG